MFFLQTRAVAEHAESALHVWNHQVFLRPFGATEKLSKTLQGSVADPDHEMYLSVQKDLRLWGMTLELKVHRRVYALIGYLQR